MKLLRQKIVVFFQKRMILKSPYSKKMGALFFTVDQILEVVFMVSSIFVKYVFFFNKEKPKIQELLFK